MQLQAGRVDVWIEYLNTRLEPTAEVPHHRFSASGGYAQLLVTVVPTRLRLDTRFETFDPDRSKDHDRTDNYVLGLTHFIKGEDIKMLVDWFHTVPEEPASGEAETQDKLVIRMQTVF